MQGDRRSSRRVSFYTRGDTSSDDLKIQDTPKRSSSSLEEDYGFQAGEDIEKTIQSFKRSSKTSMLDSWRTKTTSGM